MIMFYFYLLMSLNPLLKNKVTFSKEALHPECFVKTKASLKLSNEILNIAKITHWLFHSICLKNTALESGD